MRIRPANPSDHETAAALYSLLNPKAECTPESFQAFLNRDDQHVFLAEDQGGRVLGLIEWTVWPGVPAFPRRVCFIQDLVVFPAHRRQGVGAALLNHACTWSQEQGISIVHVQTDKERNDTGQRFYTRNGFQAKALGMYRTL